MKRTAPKVKRSGQPAERPDLQAAVAARITKLGITQAEAARRGGMTPAKLSEWLAGRRDMYVSTLIDLFGGIGIGMTLAVADDGNDHETRSRAD